MEIEKIKEANTKYIGKKIEYFEKIESTHLYAKTIAQQEENNGLLILADIQTGGIGTKGRKWYTGKGKNIAMTIILRPKVLLKKLEGLTVKVAQWMQEIIQKLYGCELQIKEPNDLYLANKKIGGILIEVNTLGEKINYLLISMGFNVNENKFPEEVRSIATSLKNEYQKDFTREEIIVKLIEKIEKEMEE